MYKTTASGLRVAAAGHTTQVIQLGSFPGELVQISEPMSPLILTCGMCSEPYGTISSHLPRNPGCYILLAEEKDGEHVAYVGEGGDIFGHLRAHEMPTKHKLVWFAVLSSSNPFLSKTHLKAIEPELYHLIERFDGLRVLGSAPPIFPMSPIDTLVSQAALETAKRLLAHAGLPLGLTLSPKSEEVACEADPEGIDMMPKTYATCHSTPVRCLGSDTSTAESLAIGSDLDGGFMMHAGTEHRSVVTHKLAGSKSKQRRKGDRGGDLEPIQGAEDGPGLKRSTMVGSAMGSANVLAGYAVNDEGVWMLLDGSPVTVH